MSGVHEICVDQSFLELILVLRPFLSTANSFASGIRHPTTAFIGVEARRAARHWDVGRDS